MKVIVADNEAVIVRVAEHDGVILNVGVYVELQDVDGLVLA